MKDHGSYSNEYLLTNSLGTYSSSNYLYGNTRKYHSLLASLQGTHTRQNVLNRILDNIVTSKGTFALSTNIYQNHHLEPEGYKNISKFDSIPYPEWTFDFPGTLVKRTHVLLEKEDALMIKYSVQSTVSGKLTLSPMINVRGIHELGASSSLGEYQTYVRGDYVVIANDLNTNFLSIWNTNCMYFQNFSTYFRLFYPDEEARGYEAYEDLLIPGFFEASFYEGLSEFYFKFSLYNTFSLDLPILWKEETNKYINTKPVDPKNYRSTLIDQSKMFIIKTGDRSGILAGYHWFDEWARDTFISLFGLAFTTDKFDIAESILRQWSKNITDGLLPNRIIFKDKLNSLDGIFWYVVRLYQYCVLKNDFKLAEEVLPEIEQTFIAFQKGLHDIQITPEGFLYDSNTTEAMTWMDAKVDNKPVIDRSGMAVEIQGLWYNYIRILLAFKERVNDRTHITGLKELKVKIEKNFKKVFWNSYDNCLFDCVRADFSDKSVRPNQVIVLYLPFKLLSRKDSKTILSTVERKLLATLGLRTLTQDDPQYIGSYEGDQQTRDRSYHQGVIWPYLLGFYLISYLAAHLYSPASKEYVRQKLALFFNDLRGQNLLFIPELFNSDDLKPGGCLAQAWNVAMLNETYYYLEKENGN